jgi:hypothetical protein
MVHTVEAPRAEPAGHLVSAGPRPAAAVSRVALTLLETLDRAGIRYCHWKSDPRGIDEALSGVSDLDLLVDHAQAQAAGAALVRSGFKRAVATPALSHPAVADYLALEADTSTIASSSVSPTSRVTTCRGKSRSSRPADGPRAAPVGFPIPR